MELVSRPAQASDWAYISDCMRRGIRSNVPHASGLGNDAVTELIQPLLAALEVTVWHPPMAPDAIVSFMVHGDVNVVAWIHVRREFRDQGLALRMLRECGYVGGEIFTPFMTRAVKRDGFYRPRLRPWLGLQLKERIV